MFHKSVEQKLEPFPDTRTPPKIQPMRNKAVTRVVQDQEYVDISDVEMDSEEYKFYDDETNPRRFDAGYGPSREVELGRESQSGWESAPSYLFTDQSSVDKGGPLVQILQLCANA